MIRLVSIAICVNFFIIFTHSNAEDASVTVTVSDQLEKPVADAVIVLKGDALIGVLPSYPNPIMSQRDMEFEPHVLAIAKGTEVWFPNNDNFRHHVYSFSKAKQFEIRLYGGAEDKRVTFDKPGAVALGCNIHDSMLGYIFVSDSPYVLKTNAEGKVTFPALQAGSYTVQLWHPRLNEKSSQTETEVTLNAGGTVTTSFSVTLKRARKNRRKSY